eukprot:NODE_1861_length_1377_cov_40.299699_g1683_i0.p1 GENE.NODE_1861_length_1377_cov_40.299699_g1683_i0~~NODE_1861_length_1377_cov_40.299699_g1683_i0.p1  ORF type:complete len:448 (+),score=51.20 NODE_1861_length_1377_cov_40.299699_g1683_i0:112-1344(+)
MAPMWPKGYVRAAEAHVGNGKADLAVAILRALLAHWVGVVPLELIILLQRCELAVFFDTKTQGMPIQVRLIPAKGAQSFTSQSSLAPNKGIFAIPRILAGETIFVEIPCISVETVLSRRDGSGGQSGCGLCLRVLDRTNMSEAATCISCGTRYCGAECKDRAASQFHLLQCGQHRERYARFTNYCDRLVPSTDGSHSEPENASLLDVIASTILLAGQMWCTMAQQLLKELSAGTVLEVALERCRRDFSSFVFGEISWEQACSIFDYKSAYDILLSALMSGLSAEGEALSAFRRVFTQQGFWRSVRRIALSCLALHSKDCGRSTRGIGLFHLHGSINHSCEPNCLVQSATGTDHCVSVVALKDIPSGDEIRCSYLGDELLPLHVRQRRLKESYEFECRCELCAVQLQSCYT